VVSSMPWPHFTPGKYPVPILQEAGWAPGPVLTGGKSRSDQVSTPDRPARSQTPNDNYSGRTAPLTSKRYILYIYSTNTGTEYFKYGIYSPFLSLQNAVCFIILMYLVPVLFTFYIQGVLKFKKIIPAPKG